MKLNASTIEGTLKAGRHSDGRNLWLTVTPTGAKSWVFMWKTGNGKRREMGLGSFTGDGAPYSVSLKQARLRADAVRAQLERGEDPLAAKQQAKLASVTFEALMLDRIAMEKPQWKPKADGTYKNEKQWLASLRTHAAKLLPMQVGHITAADVVDVLKPIWQAKPETAERVRYRIDNIMTLAIGRGAYKGDNPARYKGHIEVQLGKRPTKTKNGVKSKNNHAALHHGKVPAFMERLLGHEGNAAKALAFAVLTATRTDEARLMTWSEVDLDAGEWTIPAERMKAGIMHIVPLSTLALTLLRSLPRMVGNAHVFPGKKEGAALGATALADKLEEMGFKGEATVHGMRSAFRDWVGNKLRGYNDSVFEHCLAHGLPATEGSYRRETAIEQRAEVMQAWADHCEGKSNVVALRVAA